MFGEKNLLKLLCFDHKRRGLWVPGPDRRDIVELRLKRKLLM